MKLKELVEVLDEKLFIVKKGRFEWVIMDPDELYEKYTELCGKEVKFVGTQGNLIKIVIE